MNHRGAPEMRNDGCWTLLAFQQRELLTRHRVRSGSQSSAVGIARSHPPRSGWSLDRSCPSVQVLSTVPLVTTHEQSASGRAYDQYGTGDTWRNESYRAQRGNGRP